MKSKYIFMVLLLSFMLHISHDLLITNESIMYEKTSTQHAISQDEIAECCDSCDIHELFHYDAILSNLKTLFFSQLSKREFSVDITPLDRLKNRTFRPPIA